MAEMKIDAEKVGLNESITFESAIFDENINKED